MPSLRNTGNRSMEWQPATVRDVKQIIVEDLQKCDQPQLAAFKKYAVGLFLASILRYGRIESVVVIARKGDEVIYWEDVEDGFNVSPISPDGRILEHWCNQDEMGFALNAWIEGRGSKGNFSPAKPLE